MIETRYIFYTGKGGVGKTSVACATAINLTDTGKRVLLVSTDPASNLDDVLQTRVGQSPTPISGVPGLDALNLDPEEAARAYREQVVGSYRDILPDDVIGRSKNSSPAPARWRSPVLTCSSGDSMIHPALRGMTGHL